jgi:tetratricopeptide (TPR) repeat protein
VAAAALAGALLLVYLPLAGHPFLRYDDQDYVTANPRVLAGLSTEGAWWALTAVDQAANWHPVTWLSHQADVTLFGAWAGGHHLASLAYYLAGWLLLAGVLRAMTGSGIVPLLAAALPALHPAAVESVAWIAQRKGVLSLLLLAAAAAAWLAHVRRPGPGRYLAAVAAASLGFMAKPTLVVLPLLLLVLDFWPLGRAREEGAWPRLLLEKVPLLLLAAGASLLTWAAQERGKAIKDLVTRYPPGVRVANALDAAALYLGEILWPADLAVFYPHPGRGLGVGRAALAALLLALLTLAAFLLRRRRPSLLAGWVWYLASLAPVIGLVQVGDQGRADRYLLLPLAGLALALTGVAGGSPGRRRPLRAALAPAVLLAGLALAFLSRRQLASWRSDRDLWEHAAGAVEENWLAYVNLGALLIEEGRFGEAVPLYQRALAHPDYRGIGENNLGVVMLSLDRLPQAVDHFRRAIAVRPRYLKAWRNLGLALERMGDAAGAREAYRRAAELEPVPPASP